MSVSFPQDISLAKSLWTWFDFNVPKFNIGGLTSTLAAFSRQFSIK